MIHLIYVAKVIPVQDLYKCSAYPAPCLPVGTSSSEPSKPESGYQETSVGRTRMVLETFFPVFREKSTFFSPFASSELVC